MAPLTYRPTDLPTYRPTDLPTYRPICAGVITPDLSGESSRNQQHKMLCQMPGEPCVCPLRLYQKLVNKAQEAARG
jgi:hypothetical protein